ncbi:TRAP transporter 4TM/12TM fusion protein [Sedimentibacter acidaminivorans]|uniref:TRAP transporter 4TM/12TM fusion protein n=1 Tax=Sedimentibacter acidaminivorans TaxID=913099 RepID=A0ABS4G9T6_9FIRM|nr:TRAP transporter permease [Sedimentibacter acidaminivorans]MBP1924448.1 TRAP transporter 4TM/12TM fusion protein [Sedimentibacter acidaminivorans]
MAKISLDAKDKNIEAQQTELLEKFDKESKTRKFESKTLAKSIFWIAIIIALYHFITSFIGYPATHKHRSLHVAMMLFMTFFLYPATKNTSRKKPTWYDIIFAVLALAVAAYVWLDYSNFINRMGSPNTMDIIMGTILVFTVLEASRRISGWPLVILSILFMLYGLYGQSMPGIFAHRGYNWTKLVNHIFINTEGIYGTSVNVAASYIFLFILFGSIMNKSGMGQFFNDIALALAGHTKGGPAKVAVIASGFLGSINGSAVANVVTTGAFTIPLMKKTGYSKEFAGSVEASSSVGGQLLPPIMGAAAFIMAEMLGVKYGVIVISAAIPALLYYLGILIQVQLRASKNNLEGIPKADLPKVKEVMKARGHLIIPIIFLLYMLLFSGKTVIFSAFLTIIVTIAVSMIRPETRMSVKDILDAFEEGTRSVVSVAVACAVVGIIIGVVSLTGFGLNMANAIIQIGSSHLLATLVLTMITCMILGMGLPSIPAYLITATIAAPALIQLGVPNIAAHMFVFYFAMFANITPPVALASFAAAGISGGDPMKTGLQSVKLSLAGFIVPYMFVYNSALLLIDTTPLLAIRVVITSIIGVLMIGIATEGYVYTKLPMLFKPVVFVGSLLLITENVYQDFIGLAILVLLIILQKSKAKKELANKA